MNPPTMRPAIAPGYDSESPAPSLRSIIRKSALLNLVIVLTSCPVLVLAGGPKAVVSTLEIMAGISILIWTATFALFSLVSIPRIFRAPRSFLTTRKPPNPPQATGVADRWLDGPA